MTRQKSEGGSANFGKVAQARTKISRQGVSFPTEEHGTSLELASHVGKYYIAQSLSGHPDLYLILVLEQCST